MKPDKLIDQLELYANAIVGFVVAQSLAFSLSFGTDVAFGCEITRWKALSAALILHFVLSTVAGVWALRALAFYTALAGVLRIEPRFVDRQRPEYHADYDGAYFRDTEGNKLCVVCHAPPA